MTQRFDDWIKTPYGQECLAALNDNTPAVRKIFVAGTTFGAKLERERLEDFIPVAKDTATELRDAMQQYLNGDPSMPWVLLRQRLVMFFDDVANALI
jgi:hypothetical protein